ncbi:MAG: hypothetical protein ACW98Y_09220 [Candidatus Thorarchaeota archaeon]|jgi:hypothetical protein
MIIPQVFAIVLFFLIPILMYIFTILVVRFSDEDSASRFRKWLHTVRRPLGFKSLSNEDIQQVAEEKRSQYVTREVLYRLVAVYLIIGVFLLSNIIGSFYHVIADVVQDIGNAGASEIRTWSAIVFATPFSGGWSGTFPWYGYGLWPLPYPETYHEPWNWVFHTTALVTGNPNFFQNIAVDLILIPVIFGIILLIPLVRRSVREAFLPSLLHLHVSMLLFASTLFNCFAEAFKLAILASPITIGQYQTSAEDLNGLPLQILVTLLPVLIVVFLVYLGISYKLAQTHYGDSTKGMWLFVANTSVLYWLSLVLAILV